MVQACICDSAYYWDCSMLHVLHFKMFVSELLPMLFWCFWQPLSILCRSFHDIDTYTTGFPRGNNQGLTDIFRAVKQCLPGPVSRILLVTLSLFYLFIYFGLIILSLIEAMLCMSYYEKSFTSINKLRRFPMSLFIE